MDINRKKIIKDGYEVTKNDDKFDKIPHLKAMYSSPEEMNGIAIDRLTGKLSWHFYNKFFTSG